MKDLSAFDCFVFAGGGTKGPAYIGAWQAFLNYPKRCKQVSAVAGTSVGALMACAIACKLTFDELADLQLRIVDYTKHISTQLLEPRAGIFDHSVLIRLVESVIAKRHRTNITFEQLFQATGIRLVVTVTCVENGNAEFWDYAVEPTAPVALAVAASMCIPVLFSPICYNQCRYVDGGLKCNFPLHIFPQERTLGFRFQHSVCVPSPGLQGYAVQLLHVFESTIGETISEFGYQSNDKIISIPVPNSSVITIDLQGLTKDTCVALGAHGQLSFILFAMLDDLCNILVFLYEISQRLP